ncbi:hypothetical protein [Leekyejoonella antrihumi]|uniref:Uncharacterized protein n=1 Tax=Leekyejoonella antrihumi TaxID=1660198 RepID=A0A563DPF9_9MICO|nr:hypothetical protein [Leekyejoonella antrihumi]TWP32168.1 hypothetical protein FGL98_24630 [Leekyejoonella antrihumi]
MSTQPARPGWSLWSDWCRASYRDPSVVTLEALARFQQEVRVGPRHITDIRTTARARGVLPEAAPVYIDPWYQVEDGFDRLDDCLRCCPTTGWTSGYRGRRDAWLLVLTRGLRLTRAQALAVAPGDLTDDWQVCGRDLELSDDPRTLLAVRGRPLAGLPGGRGELVPQRRAQPALWSWSWRCPEAASRVRGPWQRAHRPASVGDPGTRAGPARLDLRRLPHGQQDGQRRSAAHDTASSHRSAGAALPAWRSESRQR